MPFRISNCDRVFRRNDPGTSLHRAIRARDRLAVRVWLPFETTGDQCDLLSVLLLLLLSNPLEPAVKNQRHHVIEKPFSILENTCTIENPSTGRLHQKALGDTKNAHPKRFSDSRQLSTESCFISCSVSVIVWTNESNLEPRSGTARWSTEC